MGRLWRTLSEYHVAICAAHAVGGHDPFSGSVTSSLTIVIVISFPWSKTSAKSDPSTFSPVEMHERFDFRGASGSKSLGVQ